MVSHFVHRHKLSLLLAKSDRAECRVVSIGTPNWAAAPALAKALFAITGKRIRRLPISANDWKKH
jgi:hypothetical protein